MHSLRLDNGKWVLRETVKSNSGLRCQRSPWKMGLFGEEEFLTQPYVIFSDVGFKKYSLGSS